MLVLAKAEGWQLFALIAGVVVVATALAIGIVNAGLTLSSAGPDGARARADVKSFGNGVAAVVIAIVGGIAALLMASLYFFVMLLGFQEGIARAEETQNRRAALERMAKR